jgi:hypothetical protein
VKGSKLRAFSAGSLIQMSIAVQDDRGIGAITTRSAVNAMVDIPLFDAGTTEAVIVTATKIDVTRPSSVELAVSPILSCGCPQCTGIIDPVLSQLQIGEGRGRARDTFADLTAVERFVVLQNGDPGVRRVMIVANGQLVATRWLRAGTVRMIDLGPALFEADNVVTVIADGKPGASVLVTVGDHDSSAEAPAKAAVSRPWIAWEQGPVQPGQDLHWGR